MLAIEVEYLMERVYASEFADKTKNEWPPHPARLFSALVAAYRDTDGTEDERQALLWLEQQGAAEIEAPQKGKFDPLVTYVPTNYPAKDGNTHPDDRAKQPRYFCAQSPASPVVRFLWPNSNANGHTAALASLLARVNSLGRACSLVRVSLTGPPQTNQDLPRYVPDETGKRVLAVAGEGRLRELERLYNAGRRPPQGTLVRYREPQSHCEREPELRGHFGEMIVLRRIGGIGLPSEYAPLLAKKLRRAFMCHLGADAENNPMLSGHKAAGEPATEPHVAFAALSNVGGEFSDGHLVGLAVVLPLSISRTDRRKTLQACADIDVLNFEGLGEWRVEMANFDIRQTTLKPETWMRPSKIWTTATPILLDRYPKKKDSIPDLLMAACERAGLPVPCKVTFNAYSDLTGAPPVFAYKLERYALHATFEFDRKVRGPVLVGAGRFFGMGLMKPFREGKP